MALVLSALVSWTAVAAEEGPDPSCLLQTMAGQNLSSGLQQGQPYGWIEVCTSCFCQNIATVNAQIVSVASCINRQRFLYILVVRTMRKETIPTQHFKAPCIKVPPPPRSSRAGPLSPPLLSQGTFLLWRLSGMEAELQSAGGEVKKTPVDWHL